MIKNRFRDDYQSTADGKLTYVGDIYVLPLDDGQKKKTNWINLAFSLVFFVLELWLGMINQDSSRTFWILFPYMFLYLPIAYMFIGVLSYMGAPIRMQRAQYQGSVIRMKHSSMAVILLSVANIVLDIVYMALHAGEIRMATEFVYLCSFVALLLAGIFYGFMFDRMFAKTQVFSSSRG